MKESILAGQHVDKRPFAELFNSPEDFQRVFERLEHTILMSFAIIDKKLYGKVEITQEAIKQRFSICEKWFRIMRGEIGYGLTETLDMLPKALACDLLGIPYDPKKRENKGWALQDIDQFLKRQEIGNG